MKNRYIAFALYATLLVNVIAARAYAASVALVAKPRPPATMVLVLEGALGRVCHFGTDGKVDTNACEPFNIPQQAVMGTPIELTPPTTKSRAWVSQGDSAAFPYACYVVYGWKTARCIAIRAAIPQGFSLGRKSFGKKGEGLQFIPHAKGGPVFTSAEQLSAMLRFRGALRIAMIEAMKDIGIRSHKSTRMASFWDCGDGDPDDMPLLTVGGAKTASGGGKTANLIDAGGSACDGGALGDGGGGSGGGGGGFDGGGGSDGGGVDNAWTEQNFDDFSDRMVDSDFAAGMADFAAANNPKIACSTFIANCKDTCSTLNKIETGGCATLGAAAAAFISIPVGGVLTFYCQARVEVATAQCNATCSTPTRFQCEN